jgi:hypothetical protein
MGAVGVRGVPTFATRRTTVDGIGEQRGHPKLVQSNATAQRNVQRRLRSVPDEHA